MHMARDLFHTYLAGVVTLLASGAEAGCRQDEDLLRDGVDFPDTLVVGDDGQLGSPDPKRDRSSCREERYWCKERKLMRVSWHSRLIAIWCIW